MTLKDFKKINQNALYFAIFLEQYVGGVAQLVVASSRTKRYRVRSWVG